jgi:hypothetical protein
MSKLPATVIEVRRLKAAMYLVRVAFWDGTLESFIVPETLATTEAVRFSTLVYAQLMDQYETNLGKPFGMSDQEVSA